MRTLNAFLAVSIFVGSASSFVAQVPEAKKGGCVMSDGSPCTSVNAELRRTTEERSSSDIRESQSPASRNYEIGYQLLNQGRLREAEVFFRESARLKPSYDALEALGVTLFNLSRYAEAEAALKQALAKKCHGCDQSQGYYNLGVTLWKNGQYVDAIETLRRAVKINPANTQAEKALDSYVNFQRFADYLYYADARFDKKDYANAAAAYQKALDLEPDNANLCLKLMIAVAQLHRVDDSLGIAKRALTLDTSAEFKISVVKELYSLARDREIEHELREAEKIWRAVLFVYPKSDSSGVYDMYEGFLESNLKEQYEAVATDNKAEKVAIARELLAANPKRIDNVAFLGRALIDAGIVDEGIKRYAEAEVAYLAQLAQTPKEETYSRAELQVKVALTMEAQGNPVAALTYIREAGHLRPDESNFRVQLGEFLFRQGDYEGASSYLRRALAQEPAEWRKSELTETLTKAEAAFAQDSAAASQLRIAGQNAQRARRVNPDADAASNARVPFDTPGANSAGSSPVDARGMGTREPVISPERRTGSVALLERKRDKAKAERASLALELDQLKNDPPSPEHNVKIAEIKRRIGATDSQIIFFNFRISEELEKPPEKMPENPLIRP